MTTITRENFTAGQLYQVVKTSNTRPLRLWYIESMMDDEQATSYLFRHDVILIYTAERDGGGYVRVWHKGREAEMFLDSFIGENNQGIFKLVK